jgi:hypothetical protein
MRREKKYRVARIDDFGALKMFTFFSAFSDALKHAEYFYSFRDVV